jgi:hypothetical protein
MVRRLLEKEVIVAYLGICFEEDSHPTLQTDRQSFFFFCYPWIVAQQIQGIIREGTAQQIRLFPCLVTAVALY